MNFHHHEPYKMCTRTFTHLQQGSIHVRTHDHTSFFPICCWGKKKFDDKTHKSMCSYIVKPLIKPRDTYTEHKYEKHHRSSSTAMVFREAVEEASLLFEQFTSYVKFWIENKGKIAKDTHTLNVSRCQANFMHMMNIKLPQYCLTTYIIVSSTLLLLSHGDIWSQSWAQWKQRCSLMLLLL